MENLAHGRYVLGRVLGRGGMAQVRQAADTVLDRQVAVKLFREDLDESDAERVRTEMRTLASLSHPALVAVHDAGTTEAGRPYLVMELVDGPTLAASGPLSPDRAQRVGRDVAAALAHVHARGLVHRDVKPANILLSGSGAKLADFGIVRVLDGARNTGTGLTIGTAPYFAPEQVSGEAIGPAADVYALGLVLLESLTGHREYEGSPVESALARLSRPPSVSTSLPGPWPALLTAMTAREPSDRPTAEAVAAVLSGAGEATTLLAPRPVGVPAPTAALALEAAAAGTSAVSPAVTRRPSVPRVVVTAPMRAPAAPVSRRLPVGVLAGCVGLATILIVGTGGSSKAPEQSTPPSAVTTPSARPSAAPSIRPVTVVVARPTPTKAPASVVRVRRGKHHGKHED